jgi:hypothetical protein
MVPPQGVLVVEVVTKFHEEESEGVGVGAADVHCVEEVPGAAECSDDVDPFRPLEGYGLVLAACPDPPMLPMVSVPDDRLVDADEGVTLVQALDVLGGCYLPLELGSWCVVQMRDGLDPPIGRADPLPQVLAYPRTCHRKGTPSLEDLLKISKS